MINFFKQMLSGESGEVSSKRMILFIFVLTFIWIILYNQQTGKNIDDILKQQLFWLIQTTLILVFGERALAAWEAVNKRTKIDKTETTSTTETTKTV